MLLLLIEIPFWGELFWHHERLFIAVLERGFRFPDVSSCETLYCIAILLERSPKSLQIASWSWKLNDFEIMLSTENKH